MLGERKLDEAVAIVLNSDWSIATKEKILIINGRIKANFPKDKEVQVIYWSNQIKPNRAERRKTSKEVK